MLDSDGSSELAENDDEILYEKQDPFLIYTLPRTGQYFLKLRAWDHPSGSGEYTLKLLADDKPPIVQLVFPTENGGLPRGNTTITAQASDAESGIQAVYFWYHDNDWENSDWVAIGNDTDGSDGWSAEWDTSSFVEGDQISIYTKALDRAGNWSPAAAWRVIIDTTNPTIILNPLQNPSESSALKLTWQAQDSLSGIKSTSLEYQSNGGEWTPWLNTSQSEAWFTGVPGTGYSFRATTYDHAMNSIQSGTVSSYIPTIDTLCSNPDSWDMSATANDNTYQNATLIQIGSAQTHNFCNPVTNDRINDQDWVKIEAEAGKQYALIVNPDGSSAAVKIRLFSADGTSLLAETSPTNFGETSILIWTAKQSGTIFVQLSHIDGNVVGNGVSYRLNLVDQFIYLPLNLR